MHVRAIKSCIHIRVCVLGCRNIITQNIFARDRFHKTLMHIFSPDRLSGKEHSVFTGVAIIHCRSKGTCVILLKCSIFVKTQYFHKKNILKGLLQVKKQDGNFSYTVWIGFLLKMRITLSIYKFIYKSIYKLKTPHKSQPPYCIHFSHRKDDFRNTVSESYVTERQV